MAKPWVRSYLLLLIVSLTFLAIQYSWYASANLSKGIEILGTDTFMRLVRVEELHETGEWFDSTIERSNAPYGDELHWTRPLDVVLIVPAFIGTLCTSFSKALYNTGIWLGPVLGVVSIALVLWMPDYLADERVKSWMLLVFLTQPVILEMFAFGRPDHHSLMMVLFVAVLGFCIRALKYPMSQNYWIIGFILGLSCWVSVESIVLVAMVFLTFGLGWLLQLNISLKDSFFTALSLSLTTILCIFAENPWGHWGRIEYDKISIVYAILFLIITAIFGLTHTIEKRVHTKKAQLDHRKVLQIRWFLLCGISLAGAIVMVIWYPDLVRGPFADVNPAIKPIWLDKVAEVQPLLNISKAGIGKMLMYMGMSVLSFGYVIYQLRHVKRTEKAAYLYFGVGMMLYILLSLIQFRWVGYLQIISVLPMALLLKKLLIYIEQKGSSRSILFIRPLVIVLFLFGITFVGGALMFESPQEPSGFKNPTAIKDFSNWVNANIDTFGENQILLTFLDFGPELLYRTDQRIIAAPYHRNDEGILFNYNVMTSKDLNKVKQALESRQVDWILLGPGSAEENFYVYEAGNHTFYDVLRNEPLPSWIEEMELPDALQDLRLYMYKR